MPRDSKHQNFKSPIQKRDLRTRRTWLAKAATMTSLIICGYSPAIGQTFPNKPIRIIVHSSPGGQLDVTARLVGQGMSEVLGQPVIIENKPGADGLIGIRYAKTMPGDGYTLLAAASTITIQPAIKSEPGYDLLQDFTAVGPMVRFPYLMLTAANKPYRNAGELIAAAKAKPDKLSFATGGSGGTSHLGTALLMQKTGINMLHVPYKGNAGAMPDLIAGRSDMMLESYGSGGGYVKSGRLKILGVTSTKRLPALPDVPTLAEQGVPNFSYDLWLGLLAPSGVPRDVVERLSEALHKALARKEFSERARAEGAEIMKMTPNEFRDVLKNDLQQMATLVKTLDMTKE
ncbi:Bug family tripartite tricarboxylate transporter substrate binding protein [Aquabacterium sp.]|uniref:Bug family tripartite tricarboxylate transporter substrate binding protein n=1 Tax=Aquabacterium sp. TaxID=1872578 RepID=UPI003BAEC871